ncbi:MAG: acyl carrier protein [Nitrospirae bacterium]|nr:acyl carrier protein [Nitrospirota bacterium]
MGIEDDLRSFIFKEILSGADPASISGDTELLEGSILDSFSILKLASHMEDIYKIEVGLDDLIPENIGSLKKMEAFINSKKGNTNI